MQNHSILKKIAVIQRQDVIYYHATEPMKQDFWRSEERVSCYRIAKPNGVWQLSSALEKGIQRNTGRIRLISLIKGRIVSDWVVDE